MIQRDERGYTGAPLWIPLPYQPGAAGSATHCQFVVTNGIRSTEWSDARILSATISWRVQVHPFLQRDNCGTRKQSLSL